MVWSCSVKCCSNRKDKTSSTTFYSLPAILDSYNEERKQLARQQRQRWCDALGFKTLEGKNLANARVFSTHFLSGKIINNL